MSRTIDCHTLALLLRMAANGWREHKDELRHLDAALGDGDMGVTAELGAASLLDSLEDASTQDIGVLLTACGRQLNRDCPSTFGTLLASAFIEAGIRLEGRKEMAFSELSIMGEGAIDGIMRTGHAQTGNKTMLDALVPAVRAFSEAISMGTGECAASELAVDAARSGMRATIAMPARHGRARYRPDGGVGVQDAGATAQFYLIEAFCRGLAALPSTLSVPALAPSVRATTVGGEGAH